MKNDRKINLRILRENSSFREPKNAAYIAIRKTQKRRKLLFAGQKKKMDTKSRLKNPANREAYSSPFQSPADNHGAQ